MWHINIDTYHVGSKLCYWNGRLTMSVYIYVYFYSISRFILVMKNGHKTYMMSSIDVIKLIGFSYEHAEHCTVLPCATAGDVNEQIKKIERSIVHGFLPKKSNAEVGTDRAIELQNGSDTRLHRNCT